MKMQSCSRGLRVLCRLLGFSRQAYYQYHESLTKRVFQEDLVIRQVLYHRTLQPQIGGCKLHEMMESFMEEHDISMGRDLLLDLLRENNLLLKEENGNSPLRQIPAIG